MSGPFRLGARMVPAGGSFGAAGFAFSNLDTRHRGQTVRSNGPPIGGPPPTNPAANPPSVLPEQEGMSSGRPRRSTPEIVAFGAAVEVVGRTFGRDPVPGQGLGSDPVDSRSIQSEPTFLIEGVGQLHDPIVGDGGAVVRWFQRVHGGDTAGAWRDARPQGSRLVDDSAGETRGVPCNRGANFPFSSVRLFFKRFGWLRNATYRPRGCTLQRRAVGMLQFANDIPGQVPVSS